MEMCISKNDFFKNDRPLHFEICVNDSFQSFFIDEFGHLHLMYIAKHIEDLYKD